MNFLFVLTLAAIDSVSAAIERHWKTSRQIYKRILALKEFSQSIFLFRKKAFKFELLFHC